jgi:hypothetical protein
MPPLIELNKNYFINLLFGRIIQKVREWKIKRYKLKKVKVEAKNSPETMYHLHFKVAIRDKNGLATCDNTVFDINIPATGYFFARKQLERYVVQNLDIEIIDFETETK